MKKLLIIAHAFPPDQNIGSQRPYRLAKYFPKYGWEPTVLTVKHTGNTPENIKVIETEYKDILNVVKSKFGFNLEKGLQQQLGIPEANNLNCPTCKSQLIKVLKEIIAYPDYQKGWYQYAIKAASEFLSKEKVDVIISTSFPVTSHLMARKLKQNHKISWIADLRDLWTQNHFYNKFNLIKYFERRLELKTLADADALVTVTNRFADELETLHRDKRIFCITNGYDTDDFPEIPVKLTNKFTITHTGQLCDGKRSPSLLFEVVAELLKKNKLNQNLFEIRFYGRVEEGLIEMIKKHDLQNVVRYYGLLPREEALKKQKESHILLLLLDSSNKEEGVYPAKVFEYFGARRPIIALGGQGGIVKELLRDTNVGMFFENSEMLEKKLLEYYKEFSECREVKYHYNKNIEKYNYNAITEKYADILNALVLK